MPPRPRKKTKRQAPPHPPRRPHPPLHGPPHPPHAPPNLFERSGLAKSIALATATSIVFYLLLSYAQVKPEGAVPASVALWAALTTILAKLVQRHP